MGERAERAHTLFSFPLLCLLLSLLHIFPFSFLSLSPTSLLLPPCSLLPPLFYPSLLSTNSNQLLNDSAVAFISMVVIPVWPLSMASWRALRDVSRLTGLTSAPCCNNTATASLCHFLVVAMRDVTPNLSARFGFAPFSRRYSVTMEYPFEAGWSNTEVPS